MQTCLSQRRVLSVKHVPFFLPEGGERCSDHYWFSYPDGLRLGSSAFFEVSFNPGVDVAVDDDFAGSPFEEKEVLPERRVSLHNLMD